MNFWRRQSIKKPRPTAKYDVNKPISQWLHALYRIVCRHKNLEREKKNAKRKIIHPLVKASSTLVECDLWQTDQSSTCKRYKYTYPWKKCLVQNTVQDINRQRVSEWICYVLNKLCRVHCILDWITPLSIYTKKRS